MAQLILFCFTIRCVADIYQKKEKRKENTNLLRVLTGIAKNEIMHQSGPAYALKC